MLAEMPLHFKRVNETLFFFSAVKCFQNMLNTRIPSLGYTATKYPSQYYCRTHMR